ncbi:DUF3606 domain-containing protein [Tardiphaga sp. vice304]|uniref:DUF3606 domain-containing protein n=1 Tax=unclassified Tardiphaga TaxID=2631404 RepID=UPI001162F3FC|nr:MULTISPECIES: DUF3606 domain-containing protein [unclassified Tardiphaga]QDM20599.1 DUF3606 domain-containing protein [Tardiphaga sp. vice154]QDM25730.1 DUF3606 domain-containing protein [Tardiphaga sp. vice304]
MSDELGNRGQKGSHIQMDDDLEVRNWCRHLKVTREDLHRAVGKVGNAAASVRKELYRDADRP